MPAPTPKMGKRFAWLLPHRGIGAGSPQSTDAALAPEILSAWESKIQKWSQDGTLLAAAQEALMLPGEPQALKDLIAQWSAGDFEGIPEIVLLSGADMNGALGAYAISTGKIYLNSDWLKTATQEAIDAVLTEELGHWLDSHLNGHDTQGDEGELFAALLNDKVVGIEKLNRIRQENDQFILALKDGRLVNAEAALVNGTSGDDSLTGTDSDDLIDGGSGDDTITGLGGNDNLIGGAGNDVLYGGTGINRIFGNSGDDRIVSQGQDTIESGDGSNIIQIVFGASNSKVTSGNSNDSVIIASNVTGVITVDANGGANTLYSDSRISDYTSGDQDDKVTLSAGFDRYIRTGGGNDVISISGIAGSWDNGAYTGVYAGDGDDSISLIGGSAQMVSWYWSVVRGESGNDTITIGGGNEYGGIYGDAGNDYIDASKAAGFQGIWGGEGDDTLIGTSKDDILDTYEGGNNPRFGISGDEGSDWIDLGDGNDAGQGGGGNDTFVAGGGNDRFYGYVSSAAAVIPDEVNYLVLSGYTSDYTISRYADSSFGWIYIISDLRFGCPDGSDTLYDIGYLLFQDQTVSTQDFFPAEAVTRSGNDSLTGSSSDDVLDGRSGDDYISGVEGNDILIGGEGNDTLYGGQGINLLLGENGNDSIFSDGYDVINAGDGNNSIIASTRISSLFCGTGNDQVTLNNGFDKYIRSGSGDDTINVLGLVGSHGQDYGIYAGEGNDHIRLSGGSVSFVSWFWTIIRGEAGDDSIFLEGLEAYSAIYGDSGNDIIDASNAWSFQGLWGGEGDDTLIGTRNDDIVDTNEAANNPRFGINGDDGNDWIDTLEGNDVAMGGAGNDNFIASSGNDTFYGRNRDNSVAGGSEVDRLILSGTAADYSLSRYPDSRFGWVYIIADRRQGSPDGTDFLYDIEELKFQDKLIGVEACFAFSSSENSTDDILIGTPLSDMLDGRSGDDRIDALGGDDIVIGGEGNDTISGGAGCNQLFGDSGNDLIQSEGNDYIDSGQGDDRLECIATISKVFAGDGDDSIYLYSGFDEIIDTGAGNDLIIVHGLAAGLASYYTSYGVFAGEGDDTIEMTGGSRIHFSPEWSAVRAGAGNDVIRLKGNADYAGVYGDEGNDLIDATQANSCQLIEGGIGDDTIFSNDGDDLIVGGAGNDLIVAYGGNNTAQGGSGNDEIIALSGNDKIDGGDGLDTISGGDGNDSISGGMEDDLLHGENGNDRLDGDQGNDSLFGGQGNDVLTGGDGADFLAGGEGSDTYFITDSLDTIQEDANDVGIDFVVVRGYFDSYLLASGVENVMIDDTGLVVSLLGNSLGNQITANNTNVAIDGGAGNDIINGGTGFDYLSGGVGNDVINSGAGSDTLYSGVGNDVVNAGIGNDLIVGGSGEGDDTYNGGDDIDTVKYTSAVNFSITVDLSLDQQSGTAKGDVTEIGSDALINIENVIGGNAAAGDFIYGSNSANDLQGCAGGDLIDGRGGDDRLTGGADNDTIIGGDGSDTVVFSGNRNDYGISFDQATSKYTVTDKIAARDGSDTVSQVEFLAFQDKVISTRNGIAGAITSSTPGIFTEGVILRAGVISSDPDGLAQNPNYSYQWYKDGGAISGATFATYATTSTGFGSYSVAITYTDAQGVIATVDSDSQLVTKVNNGKAVFSITGASTANAPVVGNILIATNTTADPDGNGVFTYAWQTSPNGTTWTAVGTNSSSYTVAPADEGKQIRLVVSYTDLQGFPESVTTTAGTVPVVNNGKAVFSITGASTANAPVVGNILIATNTTADPDGNGVFTYAWQTSPNGTTWTAVGTNSSSYTVAPADEGKQIRLVVSYTDAQNFSESVTTTAGTIPFVNNGQAIFSITGASTPNAPAVGNLLTATNTTADPDGNGVFTYAWQTSPNGTTWTAVGTNASSYTVAPADEGKQIRLVVSYTDLQGFPESVTTTAGTVPNLAPTVSSFSPADGSTAIAVASNITLTFSELIQRGTGAIELRSGSATGALIESFDAATSTRLSIVGSTLTIDPTNNLASSTQVFLVIPSGAIKDTVGNAYAGTTTYDFTTAAPPTPIDSTPPTITGIAVTSNQILLQFSEALDQTNLPVAARFSVTVAGAVSTISAVAAVAGNATQLRLTIATAPTSAQTVTVAYTDLTTGNDTTGVVQDTSGNDLATTTTPLNATTFSTATTAATLAANYLNLILTGTTAINGTGNANANTITGNSAVNQITGGAGNDTMDGGDGSDIYLITTNAEHTVAEIADNGTIGTDELRFSSTTANQTLTVFAGDTGLEKVTIGTGTAATATTTGTTALSINAAAAVNALNITGNDGANTLTGTAFADTINGNGGNDTLTGNAGDDILNGGAGNDTMNGGDGSDIYLITTNAEHTVAEIADNGISGTDELRFSSTTANQTLTVFAGDTGLEKVTIGTGTTATATTTGTTALSINAAAAVNALTITGNDGANTLTGTNFADILIGNGGNDTLNGGLGNDTLTGGAGADIYRFASALNGTSNVDRITDFSPTAVTTTTDRIQLENTGTGLFTAITATGTLAATAFINGAAFTNTTQRIRYESTTGNLFYDADGSGTVSASILFATLNTGLAINNTHFVVT